MTVYNFILAFLSAGLLFFALYYIFAIIIIHKKLIKKYFYFIIGSSTGSLYILFELLLSLPYPDSSYLLFQKIKLVMLMIAMPFYLLLLYECFFNEARRFIASFYILISLGLTLTVPTDHVLSYPINTINHNYFSIEIVHHYGTARLFYTVFAIITLIIFISSSIYFFLSKSKNKNVKFIILIFLLIFSAANDWGFRHNLYESIMTSEYMVYILVAFVFYHFLMEDRKVHIAVLDLSKQLQKEKEEAIHRLKLMEIYTRKSLVDEIEKGNDPTKFQPNNIQIATLFADIRDFTQISEGLMPMETVDLLNSYFNRMNGSIIKYDGEIDKLMGDCIMALFKDPDNALKSAIEIRYELDRFNTVGANGRSPLQQQINNGIGLNYGEVIIGNIGSESKMDYTVVGDIVNTASRLEALTKYYKTPLIISEELKMRLTDSYDIRFLDEALIKGKSTPVKLYEVYDFETDEKKEARSRNLKPMEEAFVLYQSGDFQGAERIYNELAMSNGDPSLPFFAGRCRNLQIRKEAGLLSDWNGVFEFMDK